MVNEECLLSVFQQDNKCNSLVADQTKSEERPCTTHAQPAPGGATIFMVMELIGSV